MSGREKKLLNLLLIVGFLLVNLAGYKMWYVPRMLAAKGSVTDVEAKVNVAKDRIDTMDLYTDEMEWLAKYEPTPTTAQEAQTKLEQLMVREAQRNGLEEKRKKLQPSIKDPALPYHRVKIEFEVNGMEASLYRWLDRLHSPNDFRAITYMRMNPQKDDDTKITCMVVVEQWFVPEAEPVT